MSFFSLFTHLLVGVGVDPDGALAEQGLERHLIFKLFAAKPA